jgi:hypothetical protein
MAWDQAGNPGTGQFSKEAKHGLSNSQTFTFSQSYNLVQGENDENRFSGGSSMGGGLMPLGGSSSLGFIDVRLTRPPDGMKSIDKASDSKSKSLPLLHTVVAFVFKELNYLTK